MLFGIGVSKIWSLTLVTVMFMLVGQTRGRDVFKISFTSTIIPRRAVSWDEHPGAATVNAGLKVVVPMEAGANQIFNEVVVDTGSGVLWVGAQQPYVPGPYTQRINRTFGAGYGEGYVNGTEYLDRVTIGDATAKSQYIGAAHYIDGFQISEPFDGILGLGPPGSTYGHVPGLNATPTFVQTLVTDGVIAEPVYGVYVSPLHLDGSPGSVGEITFGGVDKSKVVGKHTYALRLNDADLDEDHWWVNTSYIGWGGQYSYNETMYSLVDTGSYFIGIPIDTFLWIVQNVPGTSIDNSSLLASCLICADNSTLSPLYIGLGSLNFTIAPEDYTVPKALYSPLNITDDGQIHTVFCGAGFDQLTLGMTFLEHAYSAFDSAKNLIGFGHVA